jgi:hypothetical protein
LRRAAIQLSTQPRDFLAQLAQSTVAIVLMRSDCTAFADQCVELGSEFVNLIEHCGLEIVARRLTW